MSEPSTQTHLQTLAEAGLTDTDDTGQGTRYKRSRETLAMTRMQELHAELTNAELVDGIRDRKANIDASRAEYDVTDPDDLALELTADDGDDWAAISRWRALEEILKLVQAALSLYDYSGRRTPINRSHSDETLAARVRNGHIRSPQ